MSVRNLGQSGTTCIAAGFVLVTSTNYLVRLAQLTTTFSIPRTPTILPRDSDGAKLASGAGRYTGAGIEFDRVLAVNWQGESQSCPRVCLLVIPSRAIHRGAAPDKVGAIQ